MNKIDDCRRKDLCRRCRDSAKNFTTLGSGGLRLRVRWFGMKGATALGRIGFCGNRAKRAVIGDRDPGADRQRDDHATRGCLHIASIADSGRLLKCFLFDP